MFKIGRAEEAQIRVTSAKVVEVFNIVSDGSFGGFPGSPAVVVCEFGPEGGEERFCDSIIEGIALFGHTLNGADGIELFGKGIGGVLRAAI